jgi:hydroxyacylglutathione hydrolase
MSFPLGNTFNSDVGSMVRDTESIYLIIEHESLEEAVRDLVRIGLDRIEGWCAPDEIAKLPVNGLVGLDEIDVSEAQALLENGEVGLLDVRRSTEFCEGHIPHAINIAHSRLASRLDEVPREKPLLINCHSGKRSARASSYLQRMGWRVINLEGGILAWEAEQNASIQG